jgi:hypothetical protein
MFQVGGPGCSPIVDYSSDEPHRAGHRVVLGGEVEDGTTNDLYIRSTGQVHGGSAGGDSGSSRAGVRRAWQRMI